MTFHEAIDALGGLPYFDIQTLRQIFDAQSATTRVQVSRWMKDGRLVRLRRGVYAFGDRYRRRPLSAVMLTNVLYRPSYLGGLWLLSFAGLIPEMVTSYTSISTRTSRIFENSLGRFQYRHVKRGLFFGFAQREIDGEKVWVADVEKALLDTFYLESGEWDMERMRIMRFQNSVLVHIKTLRRYAMLFGIPRIDRAVRAWEHLAREEVDA